MKRTNSESHPSPSAIPTSTPTTTNEEVHPTRHPPSTSQSTTSSSSSPSSSSSSSPSAFTSHHPIPPEHHHINQPPTAKRYRPDQRYQPIVMSNLHSSSSLNSHSNHPPPQSQQLSRPSIPSPHPFDPSIKSILAIKKIHIKNLKTTHPTQSSDHPTTSSRFDRFYQNCLLSLTMAIDDILSDPPRPTTDSLTTLAGTCQAIVVGGSKLCDTLYDRLKDRLVGRAKEMKVRLMEGLPKDPIIGSLISSEPTLDLPAVIGIIDPAHTQDWILKLVNLWQAWYDQLLLIRSLLVHLDRSIRTRPSEKTLPIWELGLDLFRTIVIGRPWNPISLSLSIVISHQITLERSSKSTPLGTLQKLVQLFYTAFRTNGFTSLISLSLNQVTESFYGLEGKRMVQDIQSSLLSVGGPSGYLAHINRRIESEIELFAKVFTTPDRKLNHQLLKGVIRSIESNLILVHLEVLLDHGLVKLLESYPDPDSSESLRDFYRLTLRLGDRPTRQFGICFSNWIKRTGTKMVEESSPPPPPPPPHGGAQQTSQQEESLESKSDAGMIARLIEFKSKLDQIVLHCFSEDREMFYAIKEAFEFFINQRQNKPAELLAKFLDQKMRIGSKTMNESEMEDCLNQILTLFRYTQGKDIFEEFYKRDLARRLLLLSKSACSIDLERNMIMKLRNECGPGFTSKLEVMFRDIETSKDLNEAYEAYLEKELGARPKEEEEGGDNEGMQLSVSVLTAGSWPTNVSSSNNNSTDIHKKEGEMLLLPMVLRTKLERFEKFYHSKHLGRRLAWSHSLGQIVLSATFSSPSPPTGNALATRDRASHQQPQRNHSNTKELSVSTHQALILLLFNDVVDDQSLDFESIVQRTGIDEKTAARTLQSLACGKVRVLSKQPRSKDVSKTDRFSFNSNFHSDHFRIKINQIQAKETVEERSSTREKVVTERSTLIQLTIVRIMKARKRVKFPELLEDLHRQINHRFSLDVKEIKVAIESLIARDYLERLGIDQFQYLA